MIQVNFVPPDYMARIANNKEHAASSKPPNRKLNVPTNIKVVRWVKKLFLASDSTYFMYLFRHLVDMKSSFTAPLCDSSKCSFISCVKV